VKATWDRRTFVLQGSAVATAVACGLWPASRALAKALPNPDPKAVVETTCGKVRGTVADGVHIFRGIPYGAPTGGSARFKPPVPAAKWTGVRDTIDYGDQAVQLRVGADRIVSGATPNRETSNLIPVWSISQSEDCLNLNVWTPAVNRGGKRPVMVWLHPGGFEYGSGNVAFNDGTNLARRGDVVVVAINQRLGALGYLHLGEQGDLARAGNAGMLDIVLGLQWVRDNIETFGGDPSCVMIHGESGGARKVSTLLAMPGAKGLFHRAAVQSGAGLRFPSNEVQAKRTRYLFEELGLGTADIGKLQEVPAQKLMAAGMSASARVRKELPPGTPFYETYGFAPSLGPDLPAWPFDPAAPEISSHVPVLVGSNRHEMSLAFTQDRRFDEVDDAELLEQARSLVGDRAALLVQRYREIHPDASRRDLMLLFAADHSHRMDSITLAERKSAQRKAAVYMYRFDWESPVLDGLIKAAHTYEIPHVFDNAQLCSGMTGGGADAVALAAKMSSAWIQFARTGHPSVKALPAWPAYDADRRATMIFNDACEVQNDPGSKERLLWRELERQRTRAA
jgi:para-nitrobenzyl esterase